MRIDLKGKNAVVTGGAAGIGRCCAQALNQSGARVAVVDINREGVKDVVSTLTGRIRDVLRSWRPSKRARHAQRS